MNKKLIAKQQRELRNKEFAKNKDYYESLIGIIVTWTPLYIEYFDKAMQRINNHKAQTKLF